MKNANYMTPKELRILADKKEEENKVVKTAVLKHDLYDTPMDTDGGIAYINTEKHWLLTESERNEVIEDFSAQFELVLPKGTPFVCFMYEGEESWFDNINYGCEEMPKEWAEDNLENITND